MHPWGLCCNANRISGAAGSGIISFRQLLAPKINLAAALIPWYRTPAEAPSHLALPEHHANLREDAAGTKAAIGHFRGMLESRLGAFGGLFSVQLLT